MSGREKGCCRCVQLCLSHRNRNPSPNKILFYYLACVRVVFPVHHHENHDVYFIVSVYLYHVRHLFYYLYTAERCFFFFYILFVSSTLYFHAILMPHSSIRAFELSTYSANIFVKRAPCGRKSGAAQRQPPKNNIKCTREKLQNI